MSNLRKWVSANLPVDCIGIKGGCDLAPEVFKNLGLLDLIKAEDAGNLAVANLKDDVRDPATGIRCVNDLAEYVKEAAQKSQPFLEKNWEDKRILVLGGCCTILLSLSGALQKMKKDVGLVFIDGHWDCYDGKSSPNGELADMELGMLLGSGPKEFTSFTGQAPLFDEKKVFAVGPRDLEESLGNGAQDPRTIFKNLKSLTCEEVQAKDPAQVAAEIQKWGQQFKDGLWVHLDIDVLSDKALPAVDYHQPGGLNWSELSALLKPLVQDPSFRGINLTIYNPKLDGFPDYQNGLKAGKTIVENLGRILG
jgi:arginase